jgi:hypothetical protein
MRIRSKPAPLPLVELVVAPEPADPHEADRTAAMVLLTMTERAEVSTKAVLDRYLELVTS